jgi:hypothetical protein
MMTTEQLVSAEQIIKNIKKQMGKNKMSGVYIVRKEINDIYEKLKKEYDTDEKMVSFWFDNTAYNVLDNLVNVPILFFILSKVNLQNKTVKQFLDNIYDKSILLQIGIKKSINNEIVTYYHISK